MADTTDNTQKTWLVAGWPGMGNVSLMAAGYLIHKLGAKPVAEVPPRGFFDIEQVEVRAGVVVPSQLPRSVFHRWKSPNGGPDLLIFIGESQPSADSHHFAHEILDMAAKLGAQRVLTFASMASQLHPSKDPRVCGVVTQGDMLADLKKIEVQSLDDGQIGGLNGVLLGAAAERGLPGVCLLGEIPYFAAGVANPKAAVAVLQAFSRLCGVTLDVSELEQHVPTMDKMLLELLERLKQQAEEKGAEGQIPLPDDPSESEDEEETPAAPLAEPPAPKPLDFKSRQKLERLFEESRRDRDRAVQLKAELDRLGVFTQYENRFLDLFKRAG